MITDAELANFFHELVTTVSTCSLTVGKDGAIRAADVDPRGLIL